MILIRKAIAAAFLVLATVAVLLVGVVGYSGMIRLDPAASKTNAETVLFMAIVADVLMLSFGLWAIRRSVHVDRELDRLVDQSAERDIAPDMLLKRLGPIGAKFNALYHRLNTISEKRALKISGLSELSGFLIVNMETAMAVTDVQGTMIDLSRSFAEKMERNRSELIGQGVRALFPELQWNPLALNLRRTGTFVPVEVPGAELTAYPIQNRENELAFVVLALERASRLREVVERNSERVQKATAPRTTAIQRIFGRIGRGPGNGPKHEDKSS